MVVLGMLAGIYIGLGLSLVMIAGAELFTGNTLMIGPVVGGKIPAGLAFRALGVVYLANFAGAVLLALLPIDPSMAPSLRPDWRKIAVCPLRLRRRGPGLFRQKAANQATQAMHLVDQVKDHIHAFVVHAKPFLEIDDQGCARQVDL
jgi:hypothetical protein